jgi:type II secretory pathway pseudopilin PulG
MSDKRVRPTGESVQPPVTAARFQGPRRSGRTGRRTGFTLIEAALVTSIVGIGVLAMLQLLAAGTTSNGADAEMTTALNLAKGIREMSVGLAFVDETTPTNWGPDAGETNVGLYDDIDDLDGAVFNPPIDALRLTLNDHANWEQRVTVQSVDPDRITVAVPNGTSPAARITVTINRNGQRVCDISWTTFDPSGN